MTTAAPSDVVTFLFTAVEGSTRRWEADADGMRAALANHDKTLREAIEPHDGFMFKHTGDGGENAWLRGAYRLGRGDAMRVAAPSGVVTFLFTDVEGSTRRWEADAQAMRAALAAHDEVLRTAIEAHGGFPFKHTGDGICAAFSSPRSAADAAVAAQQALHEPERVSHLVIFTPAGTLAPLPLRWWVKMMTPVVLRSPRGVRRFLQWMSSTPDAPRRSGREPDRGEHAVLSAPASHAAVRVHRRRVVPHHHAANRRDR
jgi:class 3 adenylate cyclase